VEVTFYCKDDIPTDQFMEKALHRITHYVTLCLVYSTPHASTWKAYCDTMVHSLVLVDRTRDIGLIVYTYNEITKNSGQFVDKWSEKETSCLANLTLGAKLPIDVIDVNEQIKTTRGTKTNKNKDALLDISSSRFFKIRSDGRTDFCTRLVSKGGVYSWNEGGKATIIHSCWTMLDLHHTSTVFLTLQMHKETKTVRLT